MGELDVRQMNDVVIKGDVTAAACLTEELLKAGNDAAVIVENGLLPGLRTVGDKYAAGEFFLPELFSAGEVAKAVVEILASTVKKGDAIAYKRTVVLGTVSGDVHDIGLNLVAATLQGAGYKVINLGKDTIAEEYIDAVKEHKPDIVGMSALLTATMSYMKTVIDALEESGLRDKVKIIVGGPSLDDAYARNIGADAYGRDAGDGLRKVESLLG